eukprot:scaffold37357_cov24-Tisochrysis_lutea.AAC.2
MPRDLHSMRLASGHVPPAPGGGRRRHPGVDGVKNRSVARPSIARASQIPNRGQRPCAQKGHQAGFPGCGAALAASARQLTAAGMGSPPVLQLTCDSSDLRKALASSSRPWRARSPRRKVRMRGAGLPGALGNAACCCCG